MGSIPITSSTGHAGGRRGRRTDRGVGAREGPAPKARPPPGRPGPVSDHPVSEDPTNRTPTSGSRTARPARTARPT